MHTGEISEKSSRHSSATENREKDRRCYTIIMTKDENDDDKNDANLTDKL